jgi:hypothetical protein
MMIRIEQRDDFRKQSMDEFVQQNQVIFYCVSGNPKEATRMNYEKPGKYVANFRFDYEYINEFGGKVLSTTFNTISLSENFCFMSKFIFTQSELDNCSLLEFKKEAIKELLRSVEKM